MRLSDFDYKFSKSLIAQYPLRKRDDSRLLVIDRKKGKIKHCYFKDIQDFLNKNDLIVLNDTKVIPARLIGKKEDTGGKVEFLLTERIDFNFWRALVKPGRRVKIGTRVIFDNSLTLRVIGFEQGMCLVSFSSNNGNFKSRLNNIAVVPLPPYIKRKVEPADKERYQTIYASKPGAVAAPTAGLHFTEKVFLKFKKRGIKTSFVTLHVNYATFKPVTENNISKHKMHREHYELSRRTACDINRARAGEHRIIAVGTTSCRVLESAVPGPEDSKVIPQKGWTGLFIYPPYDFRLVDALLTNFHLPKTTLLMLVSAFCGHNLLVKAYQEAIEQKYRFFSYGDAMLII
ncbi:MAG: tRNA preQ1(34) S-adenosylmethionine ribosyltransferase-isomerase QueA [Candidatus Omnitrophota bacterium]|nr:tRNA preQ1(34) S-adenosylmethionine ribosyltransferase-isomerase QueA [Candidatus Omnitrophota bacterium]